VGAGWVWRTQPGSLGGVKTIQVRNVPDDVHRELRTRAAAAGVSLSDFALNELERAARRPQVADVLARARARAGGTTTEAVVAAVRTGRDRT
jgi:antitoxin FitA